MRAFGVVLLVLILAGCGHSQTQYSPAPRAGMTWDRAVSIIEQGFYEDYGKERPESVKVTPEAIVLADGAITTATHAGTVVPIYGAAAVVGTTSARTVAAGQRIYLSSLQPSIVAKRTGRDNRYAVIVRTAPGVTARRIFFRSEVRAEEFADALEYLRLMRRTGQSESAAVNGSVQTPGVMSKEQYKQVQIQQLMEQNLPYEEYTRRMREIEMQ